MASVMKPRQTQKMTHDARNAAIVQQHYVNSSATKKLSSPSLAATLRTREDKEGLWMVLLFVFLDILGFSIILPLLPYYCDVYNATPWEIGCLMSSNALAQLVAAPMLGRVSDMYGRKPILLLCIAGTVASFFLLAVAESFLMVILSRILDGILGGNISLAQAYIADITSEQNRAKGLGLVGAAFGVGFIIGPAIGGTLTVWGYRAPVIAAAALSVINLFGAWYFLKESLPPERRDRGSKKNGTGWTRVCHSAISPLTHLYECCILKPRLGNLLFLRFCYGLLFTLYETTSSIYNKDRFQFTARESSYLLCYVGLLFAAVQGGVIGRLIKPSHSTATSKDNNNNNGKDTEGKERIVIVTSFLLLSGSLFLWSIAWSPAMLLLALLPFSLSAGALNTLINSLITKEVQQHETGRTLGLSASVGSLTRVVAPLFGGGLLQFGGESTPGLFGCCVAFCLFLFSYRALKTG